MSTISVSDLEAMIKQVLSNSSPHTALSVTPGTFYWFFYSACCNHMTSDSTLFSSKRPDSHAPTIHTANGSHMNVSHIGHIFTSTLSFPHTYLISKLTLNLLSVGQLRELGLDLHFS